MNYLKKQILKWQHFIEFIDSYSAQWNLKVIAKKKKKMKDLIMLND